LDVSLLIPLWKLKNAGVQALPVSQLELEDTMMRYDSRRLRQAWATSIANSS